MTCFVFDFDHWQLSRHSSVFEAASIVLLDGNLTAETITAAARIARDAHVPGETLARVCFHSASFLSPRCMIIDIIVIVCSGV